MPPFCLVRGASSTSAARDSQLLQADGHDGIGHHTQLRQAPRCIRHVVALDAHGTVEFDDPGGVKDAAIDFDRIVIESSRQRLQAALDQIPACIVVGQIDGYIKCNPLPLSADTGLGQP